MPVRAFGAGGGSEDQISANNGVTIPSTAVSEVTVRSSSIKKEYVFESWTTHSGLPVNHINDLYQSPDGYIWLATFSGLIRFDGVRFLEFNSGSSDHFLSNRILLIQGGANNSFWITTEHGDLILADNGTFRSFDELSGTNSHVVLHDQITNSSFIGSNNGLYQFNGENLKPTRGDLFEGVSIANILRSSTDELWIFTSTGKAFRFKDGDLNSDPVVIATPRQDSAIIEDEHGRIWLGRQHLGYIENDLFTKIDIPEEYMDIRNPLEPIIFSFRQVPQSSILLVSTQLGLMQIDESFGLEHIDLTQPNSYSPIAALQGNTISVCPDGSVWSFSETRAYKNGDFEFETHHPINSILCDLEQNIWFGTDRQGLLRYRQSLFDNITFEYSTNNFYGVFADSYDGLWIGRMYGELSRIDSEGQIERYQTPTGWASNAVFEELSDGSFITGNQHCRPEHRTQNGGCSLFEYIEALEQKRIRALFQDSKQTVWTGTQNAIFQLRQDESGTLQKTGEINVRLVRFFLESIDNSIWFATNGNGVGHYRDGIIEFHNLSTGLSSNNIRSLYEDDDGYIWVVTEDRGLNRIHPESGDVVVMRKKDGLYEDALHFMIPDNFGRIWFSSNRGVFWTTFDELRSFASGQSQRISSLAYTERDGMLIREANGGFQNSGLRTADGRIWFPTQNGVLVIDPRVVNTSHFLPPVLVETATSSGASLFDEAGNITIAPNQRSFTIGFNCPVFMAPERVHFKYKLEGFDSDWVSAGNRREANYTNIPAGKYTFRVTAFIDNEQNITQETTKAIVIDPFFYETVWFPMGIVFLIILFLAGGYQLRLRHLLRREKILEKLVNKRTEDLRAEKRKTEEQAAQLKIISREKSRFFANISHEFRTPLTLIISPLTDLRDGRFGLISAEAKKQADISLRNAQRLLRLVGQMMDLARLEEKKFEINLKAGNICNYLRAISEPFKGTALKKDIQFHIQIPDEPVYVHYDPGHFDKIIANLLSNAFKFTPDSGTITLSVTKTEQHVEVVVSDSGPGIEPKHLPRLFDRFYQVEKSELQPGSGIGLSLAKQITELHHGNIEVESTLNKGSTFTVRLPVLERKLNGKNTADLGTSVGDNHRYDYLNNDHNGQHELLDTDECEDPQTFQKSILVVDDHADIRAYLKRHLEAHYSVVEATSGNEAISILNTQLPDLILSDVMMPDGDGFELLKAIRENTEYSFLPVLLLTARAEAEDKLKGLGIGANDYINKPFDIREVLSRINNLFDQQKRLLNHFSTNGKEIKIHHDSIDVQSSDQLFLGDVKNAIQQELSNENFSVEQLAEMVNQSRSNLHRRLTKATGETPSSLIRRVRLELGAQLLKQNAGTVSEIAYSTGFKSVSHFSRVFTEHFGQSPSTYQTEAFQNR
ncbi:MAG: ATP-binding protein [Cyclonatronaceae bacterium]